MTLFDGSQTDWDTLRQGVYAWARAELDSSVNVFWSQQNAPQPVRPLCRLNTIALPVSEGMAETRVSGIVVGIKTVTQNVDYSITLNEVTYTVTSADDPDVTADTIRQLLFDALSADFDCRKLGSSAVIVLDVDVVVDDISDNLIVQIAEYFYVDSVATFSIDVQTDQAAFTAMTLIKQLEMSLWKDTVREAFHTVGWSVQGIDSVRKLDGVVNSRWEERAGFDLRLGCRAVTIDAVYYLETLAGALASTEGNTDGIVIGG